MLRMAMVISTIGSSGLNFMWGILGCGQGFVNGRKQWGFPPLFKSC
jgi:hypothetical protein